MRTKFLKAMAIFFTVVYGIVILGYIVSTITTSILIDSNSYYSSYYLGEVLFYILIIIISGVITLTPWYALASLSADHDALLYEQTRLREELHFYFQNPTAEQQPSAFNYSYSSNAVHTNNSTTTNMADNKWLCKKCGELNPNSSRTCKGCGNQK